MEQLPLEGGTMRRSGGPRGGGQRPNIPLPVLLFGSVAVVVLLFAAIVLVKMGQPAKAAPVSVDLNL